MKKAVKFFAIAAIIASLFACATMRQTQNIVEMKEFIYCDDAACEVCHGEGLFTCTDCDGSGDEPCSSCDATGHIDCEPALLFDCHDGNCYLPSEETYVECQECYGRGFFEYEGETWTCEDCSGDAILDCTMCDGTGVRDCSNCVDGVADCSTCAGGGELAHGEWNYFAQCTNCETRLESGATSCTECGFGATAYECKDCGALFNEEYESCPDCGA